MQIKSAYNHYQDFMTKWNKELEQAAAQKKSGQPKSAPVESEPALVDEEGDGVILELSGEQPEEEHELSAFEKERLAARDALRDMEAMMRESKENKIKPSTQAPEDKSGQLTKRLVAAISQLEIQQIIGEASKSLASLRTAAAMGDKDTAKAAKAIIRKLEKLIQRSHRKVSDLNKEDGMRKEQTRAEQQQKQQRAEEIKKELREHIRKRKEREKKYLRDDKEQKTNAPSNFKLDAATEAKIEQQAQLQAAAEVAAPAGDMGADMAVSSASSGVAESGTSGAMEGAAVGGAEGGEAV